MIIHGSACADVIIGDCVASLRALPDGLFNSCVTSPPYYGLRDYGVDGQIGLEETPDAYVARLVEVFREVRRVLRDDATLWINIGDSYSNASTRQGDRDGNATVDVNEHRKIGRGYRPRVPGCKNKDLIGIPWMLAFALRADGWYLRQEIIWSKPNPMPESVRDRCTKAHEQIFLLSKTDRYFYDHEAIKEPASTTPKARDKNAEGYRADLANDKDRFSVGARVYGADGMKNKRSVWTVAPKPYSGAHFAVYPPDLIEPCILAGCPAGGLVLDPFGGSGTTAGVALAHGRNAIMCELKPEYAALMLDRVRHIVERIAPITLKDAA